MTYWWGVGDIGWVLVTLVGCCFHTGGVLLAYWWGIGDILVGYW